MPFQAGVAGEGVPRARFVNGADRNLTTDQIYESTVQSTVRLQMQ